MEVIAGALTQGQLPQGIGQLNGMALQPLRTGPVAASPQKVEQWISRAVEGTLLARDSNAFSAVETCSGL